MVLFFSNVLKTIIFNHGLFYNKKIVIVIKYLPYLIKNFVKTRTRKYNKYSHDAMMYSYVCNHKSKLKYCIIMSDSCWLTLNNCFK